MAIMALVVPKWFGVALCQDADGNEVHFHLPERNCSGGR
jgi:hypothetical protein